MWIVIGILVIGIIIYPLIFMSPIILGKYDKDIEDIWPLFRKQNKSKCLNDGSIYFPSRRSVVLTILTWGIPIAYLVKAAIYDEFYTALIAAVISLLLIILDSTTGYVINNSELITKSLFFKGKVGLQELKTLSKSNNLISAPALSLKRLEIITTSGDLLLISPVEEDLFLKILKERAPSLTIK